MLKKKTYIFFIQKVETDYIIQTLFVQEEKTHFLIDAKNILTTHAYT